MESKQQGSAFSGHAIQSRPCILVAEDYGLIAHMLVEDLSEAGFNVSGPFRTCDAAIASLTGQTPDAAILDIELSDGPCVALAERLRAKQIPFLILGAPWLAKPMSHEDVLQALRTILQVGSRNDWT
jgi:DNA-binding response OmpR family regulator